MPESAATQTAADMTYAKPHEFLPTGGSNRRAARMQAAALRWLVRIAALLTAAVLVFLIGYILVMGIPNLKPELFAWEYNSENVSLTPALINTVLMTAFSLAISTPLGIFAAIWDEVKDRLNKSALGMSGGQQQRLCIARALAVEPEVLLMDEPTSALDPISTSKVEELATELKENYTIVMVTHNMQQAARISDKTAFFLLGELVEMGPTERVFATPVDKRTEDYISGRFG